MSTHTGTGVSTAKGGGQSWSSYWASLISATVEQAQPTHVVLTFGSPKTSLGASDFTIAGFTVSSASWAGNAITLVLSTSADYGDSLIVTFVKTGETHSVTNNISYPIILSDGNTVAWYKADDLTTITKNAETGEVSRWNDYLGSGHDLIQGSATKYPIWSSGGITFDGSNDYMQTEGWGLVQPTFIYLVFKQATWTSNDYVMDGLTNDSGSLQQRLISPELLPYAGNYGSSYRPDMDVNDFGIIRLLFNGATSKVVINKGYTVTANFGSNNMNGITLGCKATPAAYSNIVVKEMIVRKIADASGNESDIYSYLKTRNEIRKNKVAFNVLMEGHSFMAGYSYLAQYLISGPVNTETFYDGAVNASTVTDLVNRQATFDSYLISETALYKNISVIWIGVNGMDNTVGCGTTIYNALKSYVQNRLTAGHRLFLYTVTPTDFNGRGAQFEIERNVFNNLLRNDLALLSNVYILDTDLVPQLNDYTDALYFADRLHLTKLGYWYAANIFKTQLAVLYP